MSKQNVEKSQNKALQQSAPAQPYPGVFDEMDRWFDEAFSRHWMAPFWRRQWTNMPEPMFGGRFPKVDVIDRPTEILVRAELPGVSKDNLNVTLSDSRLSIKASTRQEKTDETGHFHRRELSQGEFQRTIVLPCEVDSDKAKANFNDGILELTIPKIEAAKRKTIKID